VQGAPGTVGLDKLTALSGGRLPVGSNPQQNQGPFAAQWSIHGDGNVSGWLGGDRPLLVLPAGWSGRRDVTATRLLRGLPEPARCLYLMACGLIGEPTEPVKVSGGAASWNS
jgi:hypothetical protein